MFLEAQTMLRYACLALVALPLAACGDRGEFPSLAKRPIEVSANQPPPAPVASPGVSDPAALARVSAALEIVRRSVAPFDQALAAARPAVAAAVSAEQGSERWIEGQLAASRLEPLLVPATTALADLEEELRLAMTKLNSADRPAIEAALVEASTIVARQAEAARELTDRLD